MPLSGSVVWVSRAVRPAPDASQVSDYFRRRTGAEGTHGEQLAEQIAQRLETRGDRVGWEWMVEREVRNRMAGSAAV